MWEFEGHLKVVFKIAVRYLLTILFRPIFHRISTKYRDIITGPINSKVVTFDLDLQSEKQIWQEPLLKPMHENKHFGI